MWSVGPVAEQWFCQTQGMFKCVQSTRAFVKTVREAFHLQRKEYVRNNVMFIVWNAIRIISGIDILERRSNKNWQKSGKQGALSTTSCVRPKIRQVNHCLSKVQTRQMLDYKASQKDSRAQQTRTSLQSKTVLTRRVGRVFMKMMTWFPQLSLTLKKEAGLLILLGVPSQPLKTEKIVGVVLESLNLEPLTIPLPETFQMLQVLVLV